MVVKKALGKNLAVKVHKLLLKWLNTFWRGGLAVWERVVVIELNRDAQNILEVLQGPSL